MKYKCIVKYVIEDTVVMNVGDIIVFNDNNLFNISRGTDYKNITNMTEVLSYLEAITDEPKTYSTPADKFRKITESMVETFNKKNHDYGNSFEESLDEEGIVAARVRLGDKWNRFKQLSKGIKPKVKDESLRDTILDMANYLIMTAMWLDDNV